jgi:mannose-1-phosphate guanylyltransferase/mannose-1-phosphate guanylyltransferase/mannose-6-phosphate isomerase
MNIIDETRPWGNFRQFTHGEPTTVKILTVKVGEAFSLQYHHSRDEFWKVLSGTPIVTVGDVTETAEVGQEFFITHGTQHRVSAGNTDATILEISFGQFDETDIVRLEDNYGRT